MPSAETQTTWSWLQDLSVLTQLTNTHKELEWSLNKQDIADLREAYSNQLSGDQLEKEVLGLSFGFVPLARSKTTSMDPPQSQQEADPLNNSIENNGTDETETHLPQIIPTPSEQPSLLPRGEGCGPEPSSPLTLPPITKRLEQIDCSSRSDLTDQEEEVDWPDLSLPNLPWPTILQYMRESESYAAKYFSLRNKHTLQRRLRASKSTPTTGLKEGSRQKTATSTIRKEESDLSSDHDEWGHSSTESSEESGSDNSDKGAVRAVEEDLCEFCGEKKPKYSVLATEHEEREDLPLCCDEYKEFCILVATCLRQMVDKLQHGPPKKISVKFTKKEIKKTAEQRAFELMCRRHKWEQLMKKKSRNLPDKTTSTVKQTRIIQFSLLSTSTLDTGWMVGPQPASKHHPVKQKRTQVKSNKRKRMKQMNVVPAGILKRLANEQPPVGELEQRLYNNGSPFVTVLPNRTGQYYYQSGNLAVSVFSPYSGVLAYLLYEDASRALLGYLDELGRVCYYHTDGGGVQLYSSPSGGMMFDQKGLVKRKWTLENSEGSSFQPTTIILNKQLTVRYQSRGSSVVTFTSEHKAAKFSVNCRLHKEEALESLSDNTYTDWLGEQLQQKKKQIGGLLQCLQSSSRFRKLAQMRSVYDPGSREAPHKGVRQRTVYDPGSREAPHKGVRQRTVYDPGSREAPHKGVRQRSVYDPGSREAPHKGVRQRTVYDPGSREAPHKGVRQRTVYDPGSREAPHKGVRQRTRSTGALPSAQKHSNHTHTHTH